jgi:hypothetical protein
MCLLMQHVTETYGLGDVYPHKYLFPIIGGCESSIFLGSWFRVSWIMGFIVQPVNTYWFWCLFESGWRLQSIWTMKKIQVYLVPVRNRISITRFTPFHLVIKTNQFCHPDSWTLSTATSRGMGKHSTATMHYYLVPLLHLIPELLLSYIFVPISLILPFLIPVCYVTYRKSHAPRNQPAYRRYILSWMQLAICHHEHAELCTEFPHSPSDVTPVMRRSSVHVDCQRTTNPPTRFFSFPACLFKFDRSSIDRSKEMHWILFLGFLVFWDLNETAGQAKDKRGEGGIRAHIRNSGTWKKLRFQIFERLFIQA